MCSLNNTFFPHFMRLWVSICCVLHCYTSAIYICERIGHGIILIHLFLTLSSLLLLLLLLSQSIIRTSTFRLFYFWSFSCIRCVVDVQKSIGDRRVHVYFVRLKIHNNFSTFKAKFVQVFRSSWLCENVEFSDLILQYWCGAHILPHTIYECLQIANTSQSRSVCKHPYKSRFSIYTICVHTISSSGLYGACARQCVWTAADENLSIPC